MFGRLRPPPSSPDCLERYPAKIMKDDPLSVYESTLLKLKQGSRLDTVVGPSPDKEVENPSDTHDVTLCNGSDAMSVDAKNKNPSVISMFCKYKNQAQARNLSDTTN
ncbi:hypothetical protein EUTSA_v10011023mg [Eutrema salsugineum]|uniref:Uncharacterized protein n=1 Tax=Eutrema salsugineum TaxID=72664 RepID=V4NHM9_EUTSA|nr:uncharacterized protein LOC18020744 [Eutrema salsugineum]ESQ45706.1 hypothetical protein EUTSA_v10011023mg [Eutrema salsugineum]